MTSPSTLALPINLDSVPAGGRVYFRNAQGGCQFRSRLASMGLVPGTPIEVLRNHGKGSCILCVRGCRIVLGRGMASKIEVS
jgi:Fe2+ transport system protein FeoA